jgi:signal transduction histidine kinase
MGNTVANPRIKSHAWPITQTWVWLLVLLPILLIDVIGELDIFSYLVGDRQLLIARQYAAVLNACLVSRPALTPEENLTNCVETVKFGPTGRFMVVNGKGIILARSDPSPAAQDMSLDSLIQRITGPQTDYFIYTYMPDRSLSVIALVTIPGTAWQVLDEQPVNAAVSGASLWLRVGLVFGLISFVIKFLVFFIFLSRIIYPLRRIAAQAQRMLQDDYSSPGGNDIGIVEINSLDLALHKFAGRIQGYQVRAGNYLVKITEVQEVERHKIALSLHDETMQGLVAVGQRIQLTQKALEKGDQAAAVASISTTRAVIQLVTDELRKTIRSLNPTNLESGGLPLSSEYLLRDLESLGIKVKLLVKGQTGQLRLEIEQTAYRTIQEAILNSKTHAQAKHVTTLIRFMNNGLYVMVEDDGIGFVPACPLTAYADQGRYGLAGVQERVNIVAGIFKVNSRVGKGTRVSAWLPYTPGKGHTPFQNAGN